MRAALRLAPVLVLLAALAACRAPEPPPRSVLLVSLDTVRADRLGCYGRAGAGTPALDALAARGARFARAVTPVPLTLPAHATLLTGTGPLRHRVRHNALDALAPEAETLAERLRARGMRTGAFVGSIVLAARHGLAQGFEVYGAPAPRPGSAVYRWAERPAGEVNREALAWLERAGAEPFLAWVHYMDPHDPYRPPEPERTRFAGDPYQGEIAATDRALGELLAGLERLGRLAETLVVVVADHGESLGEHGEASHGIFLYRSTLDVPLLVAGPGVRAGQVREEPVGLADVAPTILDALGAPPLGAADGRSLWPALREGAALDPARRLYAESFTPRLDYGWSELRALQAGALKLVEAPRPELYRLDRDPRETTNLLPEEAETGDALRAELAAMVAAGEAHAGAARRVAPSAEEERALRALGYLGGTHADAAPGGSLPDPKDVVASVAELNRAKLLVDAGRFADAEPALRALLAANPAFHEARVSLYLALLGQGRRAEAEAEARAIVARAERSPAGARQAAWAHGALGDLRAAEGDRAAALAEYRRAFAIPQPPESYLHVAALALALGEAELARCFVAELVARGDAPAEAGALLARLGGGARPPGAPPCWREQEPGPSPSPSAAPSRE